jgi:hypothetical protein
MEAILFFETSYLTRAPRHHISGEGILHAPKQFLYDRVFPLINPQASGKTEFVIGKFTIGDKF